MRPTIQHHRLGRVALALGFLGLGGAVLAQTQPDAGSLLQQIERERELILPKRVEPRKEPLPQDLKEIPGLTVTAKSFLFNGNTIFSSEELAPLLVEFLNRPIGFSDLMRAADTIAEHYRKAGWVVRVYLPKQDITQGVITIQIVEAVFGGAVFEGDPPKRLSKARIQSLIEAQQPIGSLLHNDKIDRGLLLADDLPGVMVSGSLVAGTADGQTDLAIRTVDEPFAQVDLSADNTASRATGAERATANAVFASPFGYGDSISAIALHTEGSDYVRLAYSAPLGRDGIRVGVNGSYLKYKVITDESKAAGLKGDSQTAGFEISYPVLRSRLTNLYLQGTLDRKMFENEQSGAISSDYETDVAGLTFYGNLFDSLGGGGSNSFSLGVNRGNPSVSVGAEVKKDDFTKYKYSLSRQQVITEALSVSLALNGQHSNKGLDSSEKFSLGGSSGVRAYPSGEASGTIAQMVNLDVRWKVVPSVTASVFYDWGKVKNRDDPTLKDRVTLKGGGLGLAWAVPNTGLNLKAVWARRDGDNPNPTPAGNDQDGSLKKNRYWLTASYAF
ncbi:ShlB/FhaC/HecB family hemolysin secretion/activation protein [beta proteobacterium MWH-UniP1]